jgi:YidC/Oxa1 family membrane protein insertase
MWDTIIINPMVNSVLWIYQLVGNFGLAIILFTIVIKAITHPLTVSQLRGTQKMQDLQKSAEWQEIQAKYKDDKEKLSQEQMKHYQELGINPLGSCLPMLIQFPVIIGLYQAIIRGLSVTPLDFAKLYKNIYPFFDVSKLLPIDNSFLWMNLSQPERIHIFGTAVPSLAIIVVITTYLQSKLMTPPAEPGAQGAQMSQAMNLYMPLFMGYLALTFASGLSLYFITSNLASVAQYASLGKVNWNNLIPRWMKPSSSGPKSGGRSDRKSLSSSDTRSGSAGSKDKSTNSKTARKPGKK